jgi:hypothetical protein|tara:strand:+ start:597 stop:746 length:150 start_codon:yes stop_codon:yes gene_type:complete
MQPTLKQLEKMIREIKLKLKNQGAIVDVRLKQYLDNLNQLHMIKIHRKR